MSINMFQLLVDNIPQSLWIIDLEFKFIYANKEYIKIHKEKNNELIGMHINNVFPKDVAVEYREHCNIVINTLKPTIKDYYINEEKMQCIIFPVINDDGELEAIGGMYRECGQEFHEKIDNDIKDKNRLLEMVVDTFPGYIFCKDADKKYIYSNKNLSDHYNSMGIDEVIGKTDNELNLGEFQLNKQLLSDDEFVLENGETKVVSRVYKQRYIETIKKPLINKGEEIVGLVGYMTDITARVKTEKRLEYLSYIDVLTGTYNRAYFQEKANKVMSKGKFPIGVIMGDVNGLKIVNDSMGHEEGDNLLKIISQILMEMCGSKGMVFRIGGDEFAILVTETTDEECQEIIDNINAGCARYRHKIINISISLGYAITHDYEKDVQTTLNEAETDVYKKKLHKEKSIKEAIVDSTFEKLNNRNIEKHDHIERVIKNSIYLGEKLNLDENHMEELILTSRLHDIGKIGVDESILMKSNKLTENELSIAQNHAEKGYRILKAADVISNVSKSVLTHHERWDGTGYPLGLKDTDIPIVARIISVVDSYDVMVNGSIYKEPMSKEEAIEELRKCAGTQFDPKIVEIFIQHLEES